MTSLAITSPSFSTNTFLMKEASSIEGITCIANTDQLRFNEDSLIDYLKSAEIAIIGTEPITDKVLDFCTNLKAICKYGVGMNNLDLKAISDRKLFLGASQGVNRRSVAELVMGFLIGHFRNLIPSVYKMSQGNWLKEGGRELSSAVIGIVGFGAIGQDLALLLKGFGCRVLCCDILDKSKEARLLAATQVSYKDLLTQSNGISFHVPLTPQTHGIFGTNEIALVQKDTFVVNTSRGEVVDFLDVCQGVASKKLGGFASDVFPQEPFTTPYPVGDRFYFTPHIGGNSKEAILAMGQAALSHVRQYLASRASL